MRVVAGTAKGRRLAAPPSKTTRPFTGKAKEGVFSSLSNRIANSRVLDLFAGSGSMAIEALSRGADAAVLVDSNRSAVAVIRRNLETCGFEAQVIKGDLPGALSVVSGEFDLVFVDPPYSLALTSVLETLEALVPHLADGATIVLHRRREDGVIQVLEALDYVSIEDERTYGDSLIVRLSHDQPKGDK
jgi:16S rRNA (guanine966-N2)-methyltransferase